MKHVKTLSLALLFTLLTFTSCSKSSVVPGTHLEVQVSGTFSGNPRSNIQVVLHKTENDAKNCTNAYAEGVTDAYGKAIISRIEPGVKYWVRAQAVISHSIEAKRIKEGSNWLSITIL